MLKWLTKSRPDAGARQSGAATLDKVSDGECVNIECLRGSARDCQRLREMGFCENAQIEKVAANGAVICKVCNSKIIISQRLAKNIVVETRSQKVRERMAENQYQVVLLSRLAEGQTGKIHDFIEENDTCARLEEMGVTPGEDVQVVRFAPLGDPVEIRIRGYLLSLRREEADLIQVRV